MAFWSSQKLEANLDQLVDKPNRDLIDCNAITLRIGREIYVTPGLENPAPNSHTKRLLEPGEAFTIPPGQFAFLLTEETLTIPANTMGFISIRARYKLRGLVNVSGFHVDPGWSGPLIFAVHNPGPASVHLQRGLDIFLLWIADLEEASAKRKTEPGPKDIPPSTINNITGVVDSIYALEKRLREELKKLSDKNEEFNKRLHKIDKTHFKILLYFSLAGLVIAIGVGAAMRTTIETFIRGLFN